MGQGIAENLKAIHHRIGIACEKAGRNPNSVYLVAVGKTHPASAMEEAILAGQRIFGENRVQEASAKWPELKTRYPELSLHLIGPLQTNKVKQALSLFDVIETVDRPKLAEHLAKEKKGVSPFPHCFVQVNIGEEPQKSGILPKDADAFIDYCLEDLKLPITGVMGIPPVDVPPHPYFSLLAEIARKHRLPHTSMGMSGDFETAIACGATYVRVGTAIFGVR